MRTLKIVVLTALITTGLQSGALATEPDSLSAAETVDVASGLDQVEQTSGDVDEIAPADATDGVNAGASEGVLSLPDAAELEPRQVEEGIAVYRNPADGYAVAVNPFAGGTQVLTVLADASAPTSFTYGVAGPGEEVILDDDGSAGVIDARTGETIAVIDKPWAVDANGSEVPTAYRTDGTNLVQVVEHRSAGVAYPVTADPKIFRCDGWTHTCVKFSKSETKKISQKASAGTAARVFATTLCGVMPGVMALATCIAVVSIVSDSLKNSFRSAAKNGKCVELHFLGAAGALTRWKVEKC